MQEKGRVTAVVEDHVGPVVSRPRHHLLRAPPVLLERLALPREDRNPLRVLGGSLRADRDGGRRVILGREDVAAGPTHLRAQFHQRLDEHGGLDGHVQ